MELDMRRYIHGQTGDFDEMRILVEGGASYTSDIDFPDQHRVRKLTRRSKP